MWVSRPLLPAPTGWPRSVRQRRLFAGIGSPAFGVDDNLALEGLFCGVVPNIEVCQSATVILVLPFPMAGTNRLLEHETIQPRRIPNRRRRFFPLNQTNRVLNDPISRLAVPEQAGFDYCAVLSFEEDEF